MNQFKLFLAGAVVATWGWQLVVLYEKRRAHPLGPPQVISCSIIPGAGEQDCICSNCAMNPISPLITPVDRKL